MKHFRLINISVLLFFCSLCLHAQKKYPSLFWEITGNGMQKPSYLFGTMHVSNKMVFHLSDSFYHAMRSSDAVALELNPELWQDQMFKVQKAQINYAKFTNRAMNDFVRERSFQLQKYEDDLKRALTEEPTVVNNLLYRSYQSSADFEENTYLDLYIYQTGRKLGKRPEGVEDYIQSERLVQEAYLDMAREKTRRPADTDGVSPFQIQKSIQEAYRKGDLDTMDSLEALTTTSPAFNEKFLYVRNDIQANSIDTILKKHSLFVGVGAAHLPGTRGVIELLRKKGYHLRPIFMEDRNAMQKDEIDKMKVPVNFQQVSTEDGMISLKLPGEFYKREESRNNESWQYADMNNGSYYMLTRVATHAGMLGENEKDVTAKINGLLYENIPGKIIKKTLITKDGLPGFDITNRTRRGDIQRYQIIVSPFEVLVFKMSGNDNYVEGKEAETFFNSIRIKNTTQNSWVQYQPKYGGFTVQLPANIHTSLNKKTNDRIARMEYEAFDKKNGNAYMIWHKSVYNLNFIEEDTFDLALIEESFQRSELVDKRLSRHTGVSNNIPYIEAEYSLKDGAYVTTKAFIKGPHYYLLAMRSKNNNQQTSPFFTSFKFTNYNYTASENYIDSSLSLQVFTSVKPDIDTSIRRWMEKAKNDVQATLSITSTLPKVKNGQFTNDSTGENIMVTVESYPKYYYSRDTTKFWKEKLEDRNRKDMVLYKKEFFRLNDSVSGYKVIYRDTNSSRSILNTYILKDNSLIKLATVTDTSINQSNYITQFFATAKPVEKQLGPSVFKNKLEQFFADFTSKDSITFKNARQSLSNLYYGKDGVDKIVNVIQTLKYGDKDYFDIKSKFIAELGYIDDSLSKERLVVLLKDIYEKNADTSYFQNAVLTALARLQTASAFKLLKELLIQDPPVSNYGYYFDLFHQLSDTLRLAKKMFPKILQLASLEDYKPHINDLLKAMVEKGYLKAKNYESYFSKLYFDAKVELKKQQNKEENNLQQEDEGQDNNNSFSRFRNPFGIIIKDLDNTTTLDDYATLLAPFYNKKPIIPKFFKQLLNSKEVSIQLATINILLKNNKQISDTLLMSIAAQDQYRSKLLSMLEKLGKKELFPAKYNNQEDVARSILLSERNNKFADLKLVNKQVLSVKGDKGMVYLFKYKVNADDDWKMGISGIQPLNANEVSSKVDIVKLTDRKLRADQPVSDQFDQQIKRLLITQHKSARQFYENGGGGFGFGGE